MLGSLVCFCSTTNREKYKNLELCCNCILLEAQSQGLCKVGGKTRTEQYGGGSTEEKKKSVLAVLNFAKEQYAVSRC